MYSITENIYCSQLSSLALLLQPEPVSRRIIQGKYCVPSRYVLSPCGFPLPPTCLLVTVNEARSYFATIPIFKHARIPAPFFWMSLQRENARKAGRWADDGTNRITPPSPLKTTRKLISRYTACFGFHFWNHLHVSNVKINSDRIFRGR
jgi:hypothetical protein